MSANYSMVTPSDPSPFPWMRHAFGEIGVKRIADQNVHNPRIILYHACAGRSQTDEVPWCSAFVNWCMRQAQIDGTGRPGARTWLQWDEPLQEPVFGCVTVTDRPGPAWHGHVGFYTGTVNGKVLLLGGNQSNSVMIKPSNRRVLGYRWPRGMQLPAERESTPIPWSR